MSEFTVRLLEEKDWPVYRDMRLRALQESPDAFVAVYNVEKDYDEQRWRDRMLRSDKLLASQDAAPVGIIAVRDVSADYEGGAEIFGLWVEPALRGAGVATELFQAAAQHAADSGHRQLVFWVGTDNAKGVAFASGRGFRPTADRRPMRTGPSADGEQEIAMTLSLAI